LRAHRANRVATADRARSASTRDPGAKDPNCPGGKTTRGLTLGTDFITDVLLISLHVDAPVVLRPGVDATAVALRTTCEALAKASCAVLGLEPGEVQADYRPALTEAGQAGEEVELYLYDTLPGGAGFVRRVQERADEVFSAAVGLLTNCAEDCSRSCYRCLRSFQNRFEHDLLDRGLAKALLRYLWRGDSPTLPAKRMRESAAILAEALERDDLAGRRLARDESVELPGLGKISAPLAVFRGPRLEAIVGVHSPLTPDEPADPALHDVKEYCASVPVILVDEQLVRRNLPAATRQVREHLG